MSERYQLTFFHDAHDRHGVDVFLTWLNLCARLSRHEIGPKDGPALACATFNGTRSNANIATRTMVALDVETSRDGVVPPPIDETIMTLTTLGVRAFVWTTHSHTPAAPRYRVLAPLSRAIDYEAAVDPHIAECVAAQIGIRPVCDPSKFGAASLFYLPRHPDGATFKAQEIAGIPIDSGMAHTAALTVAQGVAEQESVIRARRAARELDPETRGLIDEYNRLHPIVERLAAYGYRRDGNRWKSRHQHAASQGATTVLGDSWVSFSESDAAAGVGSRPMLRSSQAACYGDAFSLYKAYEHAGSFRAALESLREA